MVIERLTLDAEDKDYFIQLTYIENGDDIKVNVAIDAYNNGGDCLSDFTYSGKNLQQIRPLLEPESCLDFVQDELDGFAERSGIDNPYTEMGFVFDIDHCRIESF